jgi:alpha-ketoglutarate-dependent taurine dioxygenase
VPRDGQLLSSFAQQRLWFLDRLDPGNTAYNIPAATRLTGALDVNALEASLREVMRRHEVLRTVFLEVGGRPTQSIIVDFAFEVPVTVLDDLAQEKREAEFVRLAKEESQKPFDLERGPVFRCQLFRLGEEEHMLLVNVHHIAFDDWSTGILIQEVATLYGAFRAGQPSPLAEVSVQYGDFAVWQRQWLRDEALEERLAYWKKKLAGVPVLKLPTDCPRSVPVSYRGARYGFRMSPELTKRLEALCRHKEVTPFMLLVAVFKVLLYRYSEQTDIAIGTPIAGRNRQEIENLIGFFVNTLVLRTDLSGNPSFTELLKRVRETTLGAYDHQDLPFEKLVEALRPERNLSHTPLFQVLFVLQNAPMPALELPDLTLTPLEIDNGTSKFNLALLMKETEQGLVATWNYNADLFDPTTITRISGHFETLLGSIVTQPDARINSLKMLTEAEKQKHIMEEVKHKEGKLKKFMYIKPKAVSLPQGQLIKTDYLQPGQTLPLVVQPDVDDLDLVEWAQGNREFIETKLLEHGAILFRSFNLNSVSAFENLAQAICPELFAEYGGLPRAETSGKVYGSTSYPPDQAILFHNESSHLHRWPLKIWFFCVQSAQQGGETPIVDCRKVYQLIDPKLREQFQQKQVMYVRNYIKGLDVSWQEFFRTTDRDVVEEYCREATIDFEWLSGNGLRTRKVNPAITKHPKTGEMVFFNQIQLHHVSCLESAVQESLLSLFGEDNLPRHAYWGDHSPIKDSVMEKIRAAYQEATISFSWQQGDVLMLDNMLIAHGHNPYVGTRKIMVTMGEMIRSKGI